MASAIYWCSFFFPFLIALSLFFQNGGAIRAGNVTETDRLALLEIKNKINGDLSSWNSSIHFCLWSGVTCGNKHQRVAELNLRSMQFGGSISPHIGNLSFLRLLDLSNNSFTGEIPSQVSHLRRLQIISMNNNSLTSEIPTNISLCSNLLVISFANNQLVGQIPGKISYLSKLKFLSFWNNDLTGSIPDSLGNLSSLETFSVGRNGLSGTIPYSLGQLRNLTFFEINSNRLSGVVPPQIFNLSRITYMQMANNSLLGYIPKDLFISLPNVGDFSVSTNQFSGSIPPSLSNASSLVHLQLQLNNLTGEIPDLQSLNRLQRIAIFGNNLGSGAIDDLNFFCSLTNASTLEWLGISYNNLGGSLPECIGNLSHQLIVLSIEQNQIFGSIPIGIGNLINLENIEAWSNRLSGIIPHTIGNLKNLQKLYLVGNSLSGHIPSSLGNLSKLIILELSDNRLQGVIPSSLGECKSLLSLGLFSNNLDGNLPPQIIGLSSLSIYFDVSHNHLNGSIPKEIGRLVNIRWLDVSNNLLSDQIPGDLGECVSLEYLSMQGNQFSGAIPSSMSKLRGLQVMDLSRNNLSGQIPEFLVTFNLSLLNLSFNEFEGMVPLGGVFKNASTISIMGNKRLCGGIPELQLPVCNFQNNNHQRLSKKLRIIIATASGLAGLSLVSFLILLLRFKKRKEKLNSSTPENSIRMLSYYDLHKATNGFSQENLIGVGSFGSVYKGTINEGEPPIAVKVMNLQHHGASKSFMAECEALRNMRHRNLVKVLTACSSIDHQGNEFKALVYEFMGNGSLEEWLHPPIQHDATYQTGKYLTLRQRLNIAIDVSSALEYLHFHCQTQIVHCDLKPSNVLLDNELVAHVGDFGLAKLISNDNCNNSTNASSSIGVRGTIGYAPPEYGLGSQVSTSGDVYSYGIMLLEIFTGKRPTNETFNEVSSLHETAKTSLADGVAEIIDPLLLQEIREREMKTNIGSSSKQIQDNKIVKGLTSIIEIGVLCSVQSPRERMNIGEVTSRLSSIRDKLSG